MMGLARYRAWARRRPRSGRSIGIGWWWCYVRQSSRQQVLKHSESTRLQYALLERAVGLG